MITVTTKEALEKALKAKEEKIVIQGELAKTIIKKRKIAKGTMIGGALLTAGGLIALPFTGGASAAVVASGLTATIGGSTVVISTAELAVILGTVGILGAIALLKGYTIKVKGGNTVVELERK